MVTSQIARARTKNLCVYQWILRQLLHICQQIALFARNKASCDDI